MAECDICFRPTRNRRRLQVGAESLLCCRECREWRVYWDSLTPEEKRQEERSIAAHTAERGTA